jgi:hypothetical protein
VKKTWWLEALKDFTFHRRTPRVSGEVFQELIPIAAQMIHKKLAKRTSAPLATPDAAPAGPDVAVQPEREQAPPAVEAAPAEQPEAVPVEHEAEVVDEAASSQADAPSEPAGTRRYRRKGKPETSGDAA